MNLLAAANTGEAAVFWVCAVLAVGGAIGMLVSRKAVHSALFLCLTMINLAILYVSLQAPFLGMVQIIVYTGAIMMLFLFVLMVVGVDSSDSLVETLKGQRAMAILAGLGFGVLLISVVGRGTAGLPAGSLDEANSVRGGNVQGIAEVIFTQYVWAFEITSALLITAGLGAMVMTHTAQHSPKPSQRELSAARFEVGSDPSPLPPPGTFARHNAVDVPALLPDGTTADLSIPRPLAAQGIRDVEESDITEVRNLAAGRAVVLGDIEGPDDAAGEETP